MKRIKMNEIMMNNETVEIIMMEIYSQINVPDQNPPFRLPIIKTHILAYTLIHIYIWSGT